MACAALVPGSDADCFATWQAMSVLSEENEAVEHRLAKEKEKTARLRETKKRLQSELVSGQRSEQEKSLEGREKEEQGGQESGS